MKKVFGKYNIADPSGFKEKLKVMKKKERVQKTLRRADSDATNKQSRQGDTIGSETALSKTTGGKGSSKDGMSRDGDDSSKGGGGKSDNDNQSDKDKEEDHDNENASTAQSGNQVLPKMNEVFTTIENGIT